MPELVGLRPKAAGKPRAEWAPIARMSILEEGQVGILKKMAESIPDRCMQAGLVVQPRSQEERAL